MAAAGGDDGPVIMQEPDHDRFVLGSPPGQAELVYRRNGRRLVLVHTEVAENLGGRGIGGQLVRAAVAFAAAEGLTVVPWCPYARKWLADHPDEAAGAAIDWGRQG
jgi:predicted GNAT family acetyltransferase